MGKKLRIEKQSNGYTVSEVTFMPSNNTKVFESFEKLVEGLRYDFNEK